ncbi:MAG TPA: hypothetical protein VNK82_03600 [Terriglobales bacterium]|nr:hypothetical protein [Terriglobales bacterium]
MKARAAVKPSDVEGPDCRIRIHPASLPTPKFRSWVKAMGVRRLARKLGIGRFAVNRWIRPEGSRCLPTHRTARQIIALSFAFPDGAGPLAWEDIYGPVTVEVLKVKGAR